MTNFTAVQSRPVPTTATPQPVDRAIARRGALFGAIAATAWMAIGIESIARPHVANYRDALWALPWAFMYLTFLQLHRLQRSRTGARGDRIFKLLTVGMVLTALGGVGVFFDIDALKFLGFPLGALLWLVLMVLFGHSTVKAGVLPKYVGWALILLEPGSMLTAMALSPIAPIADRGAYSGATEKGAVIALLAFELFRLARRGTAVRAAR